MTLVFHKLIIFLFICFGLSHSLELPPKDVIENMAEKQKILLYEKHKINPYKNMIWSAFLPTSGHYRIHKWKRGIGIILLSMILEGVYIGLKYGSPELYYLDAPYYAPKITNEEQEARSGRLVFLMLTDTYLQTKKYNEALYKYIFNKNL